MLVTSDSMKSGSSGNREGATDDDRGSHESESRFRKELDTSSSPLGDGKTSRGGSGSILVH
jgi:hypothetical protein